MKKVLSLFVVLTILATMLVVPNVQVSAANATENGVTLAIEEISKTVVYDEDFEDAGKAVAAGMSATSEGYDFRAAVNDKLVSNFSYKGESAATYVDAFFTEDSTGDYALRIKNNKADTSKEEVQFYLDNISGSCDTQYIVFSTKIKIEMGYRFNIDVFGNKKTKLSDEEVFNPDVESSDITNAIFSTQINYRNATEDAFKDNGWSDDGNTQATTEYADVKPSDFAGRWVDMKYVIDVVGKTHTIYMDGTKFSTKPLNKRAFAHDIEATEYISGIRRLRIRIDQYGHYTATNSLYFDDIQVRPMTAEQADQFEASVASVHSVIEKNSTRKFIEDFEAAGKAAGVSDFRNAVDSGLINNFAYKKIKDSTTGVSDAATTTAATFDNAYFVEDSPGDYAWKVTNNKGGTAANSGEFWRDSIGATCDTEYIVFSTKFKLEMGQRLELYLYGTKKALTADGKVNPSATASDISDSDYLFGTRIDYRYNKDTQNTIAGVSWDGTTAGTHPYTEAVPADFAGRWVDMQYVIDVMKNTYTLYIDGTKLSELPLSGNALKTLGTSNYLSGIRKFRTVSDKYKEGSYANGSSYYFDDMQVRSMTAAQAAAADWELLKVPQSIKTGDVLPTTTDITGSAVTWAADETFDGITIADGTVTIPEEIYYENAVVTATIGTTSKDYTVAAGLKPLYASIEVAEGRMTNVIGNIKFAGANTCSNPSQLTIFNPIYNCGDGYKSYRNIAIGAYNIVPVTDAAGVTKQAAFTTGFKRPSSGIEYSKPETAWSSIYVDLGDFTDEYKTVWIEIDYLDDFKSGTFRYYNTEGTTANANKDLTVTGENSGKWTTQRFKVTDANFGAAANTAGEFNLNTIKTISAVRVYSASAADEKGDVHINNIGKPALKDPKTAAYDIINDGTGKLSVEKQVTVAEPCNVQVFLAIYDSAGDLKSVTASSVVTFTEANQTQTITADSTSKAYDPWDGEEIKLFVWDADTLAPIN